MFCVLQFLFMDIESQHNSLLGDGVTPKRRIETNRTVTPGGTVITTKTTTTEKSRDHQTDVGFTGVTSIVYGHSK